ncbi:MAG: mycofactocin precursor MftA [Actinomycetota bacterium]|nr:mycofactocin precursor MftA [Actinomycetota bacterium]
MEERETEVEVVSSDESATVGEAKTTEALILEEISIDSMCGVY